MPEPEQGHDAEIKTRFVAAERKTIAIICQMPHLIQIIPGGGFAEELQQLLQSLDGLARSVSERQIVAVFDAGSLQGDALAVLSVDHCVPFCLVFQNPVAQLPLCLCCVFANWLVLALASFVVPAEHERSRQLVCLATDFALQGGQQIASCERRLGNKPLAV